MKAGDVVHMKSFTHSEPGMSVGYKANSDKVAVFLLLGHAPRKTPGEFDPTDALKRLGWQLDAPAPADPADELGKVWDVLHAAGINSGGELSASEGVKLLADKVVQIKVLLNSNYGPGGRFVPDAPKPMCDHEWGAHRSQQCQQCVKCLAVRSFE